MRSAVAVAGAVVPQSFRRPCLHISAVVWKARPPAAAPRLELGPAKFGTKSLTLALLRKLRLCNICQLRR